MMRKHKWLRLMSLPGLTLVLGCQQYLIDWTDREVYSVIEERQMAALGETYDSNIGPENGVIDMPSEMYSFTPRPIGSEIPEEFIRLGEEAEKARALQPVESDPSDADKPDADKDAPDDGDKDGVDQGGDGADGPGETVPPVEPPSNGGGDPATTEESVGFSLLGAPGEPVAIGELVIPTAAGQDPGNQTPPQDPAQEQAPARAEDIPLPRQREIPLSIFTEEEQERVVTFGLSDVLAYTVQHSRDLQTAKESLYLRALDLTLERHLWTPQFVASISADYDNLGQDADFDESLRFVSQVSMAQRLPYGGDVTASIVSSLVRDLSQHVTSGESGNFILSANIPLFRGAGRVAYESRYGRERQMIYAVRVYEDFRRNLLVQIAGRYFSLQQSKAQILNAHRSFLDRGRDWQEAQFKKDLGVADNIEQAPRALEGYRTQEASVVNTKERYATSLDNFKIRIGMPVDELLDVVGQQEDEESAQVESLLPPGVDEETAIDVALRYRLDLLTDKDRVDDTRRGVLIAENRILPQLNLGGSVRLGSKPDELNSVSYNTDGATWEASLDFRIDDRRTEVFGYRENLINLRRAERDLEETIDTVRSQVRAALRQIASSFEQVRIQESNVVENRRRVDAAEANFRLLGGTNQEVTDARDALLRAENSLAGDVANYRETILEFLRDTGALRVGDDGKWLTPPWAGG